MTRVTLLCVALLSLVPSLCELGAQPRLPVQPPIRQLKVPAAEQGDSQPVPAAYRPPPGMCRIWLEGVPPGQQPAPTDCASAVRNRPNNGRVIFGDDYVKPRKNDKNDKRDPKDRRPDPDEASTLELFASAPSRIGGPFVPDDASALDDDVVTLQPPAGRATSAAGTRTRPAPRPDDEGDEPQDIASVNARRAQQRADRRDSVEDARRRRQEAWDARLRGSRPRGTPVRRDTMPRGDDRDAGGRGAYGRDAYGRDAYGRDAYGAGARGYPSPYDPRYLPGRANGTCLDRDGDGWCDDSRTGGGYCLDRDGDGRCDDYPGLASAPYASALPPMRAAADVARGVGSEAALRWLGTAEVAVRTTDLRRTGTPTRAVWIDANTGRLLQVWTDRNGDGIADRVEIYRNGQIVKTIGR